MKKLLTLFFALVCASFTAPTRIVSVGTSVTETLVSLGALSNLVAVDNSSKEYILKLRSQV